MRHNSLSLYDAFDDDEPPLLKLFVNGFYIFLTFPLLFSQSAPVFDFNLASVFMYKFKRFTSSPDGVSAPLFFNVFAEYST